MSSNTITKNTIILLGQTYLVVLIGLVIGILSARGLSVSDRGTLALLLLGTQLCSRVGSLGLEQALHKFGIEGTYITHLYISGILGVIITSPILLIITDLALDNNKVLPILVACSSFIHVLRVNTAILIFDNRIVSLAFLNICQSLLQLALYFIAFQQKNLFDFLLAWIVNVCMFSIISSYIVLKGRRDLIGSFPKLTEIYCIQKRGWKFNTVAVPEIAISFCLELPVIRSALGGVQAGLYAISNTMTGIYYQFFVAASAIVSKRKEASDGKTLYVSLAAVCFIVVLASQSIIELVFGSEYVGAAKFVSVMLPVTFLLGLSRMEQMTLNSTIRGSIQLTLVSLLLLTILSSVIFNNFTTFYAIASAYALYALALIAVIRRAKSNNRLAGWVGND